MRKKSSPPIAGGEMIKPVSGDLFDRVVSILEQARSNVVRAGIKGKVLIIWRRW
jgi:hypothetical protein